MIDLLLILLKFYRILIDFSFILIKLYRILIDLLPILLRFLLVLPYFNEIPATSKHSVQNLN